MKITRRQLSHVIAEACGCEASREPEPEHIDNMHPSDAFALGFAMGQSGEFDRIIGAREDAWAGGDNIEDPLDHADFETGESNAGPHVRTGGCAMREVKITRRQLRQLINEERKLLEGEERESEMREFSRSRSGKKVMQAGTKIRSAAGAISEVAEDQTGSMRKTLYGISEFVEKLGSSLSEIGMIEEGMTATGGLPTVQELRQLHKNIQKLEK